MIPRGMYYTHLYHSSIGDLQLVADDDALLSVTFCDGLIPDCGASFPGQHVIIEAARQLDAYFSGKLRRFDLPLRFQATGFSVKVWKELMEIPYAEVMTYKEVAASIAMPGAFRAVGSACRRNPFVIVVPCHRVVAASPRARLRYSGGADKKAKLLALEQCSRESFLV